MSGEEVRVWLTAVSAVVAALTFAIGFVRHRADVRAKKVFEWQRVVIHEIFEKSDLSFLAFSEIRSRYLAEAQSYQGERIPQKELSASSLRRIIVSMVSDRIIRQYDKDRYALDCDDLVSMQSRILANDKSRRIHEVNHFSYSQVLSLPFKFNVDQMIAQVAELKDYRPGEIRIEIEHMLNVGKILKNPAGLIGPKHLAEVEPVKLSHITDHGGLSRHNG